MNIVSQIENSDQQRHTPYRATSVESLVAALRAYEHSLRDSIQAEEERTSLSNQNDPCYSMLAHSMRARADNLLMSIATLEAARQAA